MRSGFLVRNYKGESLREIPFSQGPFLRRNGAWERSIIQFTDLLSHRLSLKELIPQRNSSLIWNLYFISLFITIWMTGVENNIRAQCQCHLPFCISLFQKSWKVTLSRDNFFIVCGLSSIHYNRARTFKCLWGPGIDSKEWIPPAYVAWRDGTKTLFFLGA